MISPSSSIKIKSPQLLYENNNALPSPINGRLYIPIKYI